MKKLATFIFVLIVAFSLVGAPKVQAASYYTYSGTEQQLINYLLQLIKELQAQIERNDRGNNQIYSGYYGPSYYNDGKTWSWASLALVVAAVVAIMTMMNRRSARWQLEILATMKLSSEVRLI